VPELEPLVDGAEDGERSPLVGDRIRLSVADESSLVEGVEDEGSFGVEVPVDGKGSPETVS
jgi:hypothetical protein